MVSQRRGRVASCENRVLPWCTAADADDGIAAFSLALNFKASICQAKAMPLQCLCHAAAVHSQRVCSGSGGTAEASQRHC